MSWDRKARGHPDGYLYTSVRTPAGVRKVYVGRGEAAAAFVADERRRAALRAAEAERRAELDHCDAELDDLSDRIGELVETTMAHAGYHHHRGEWRRDRGQHLRNPRNRFPGRTGSHDTAGPGGEGEKDPHP